MKDHDRRFFCRACGHEDSPDVFGTDIVCPVCGNQEIVLAAIWHRFKPPAGGRTVPHPAGECALKSAG